MTKKEKGDGHKYITKSTRQHRSREGYPNKFLATNDSERFKCDMVRKLRSDLSCGKKICSYNPYPLRWREKHGFKLDAP